MGAKGKKCPPQRVVGHDVHKCSFISWSSAGRKPGTSTSASSSSFSIPTLHFSSSGKGKYMTSFLTAAADSTDTSHLHSLESLLMVRPMTVLRSGMMVEARTLTEYLGLEVRLFTKFTYRLVSITFKCMHSERGSIKYLWVV